MMTARLKLCSFCAQLHLIPIYFSLPVPLSAVQHINRIAVQHADYLCYERWNLCERWNGKIGDETVMM
jgi:hypothetical protein